MEKKDRLPKHLAIGFGMAVAIYGLFFGLDQWWRVRKGAWEVNFQTNGMGHAMIAVNQPRLGITNVQIVFVGEVPTNSAAGTVAFTKPQQAVPFGKVKFEDLTYLPGSVAFDFFGHEVELLPRTLYMNKKEHAWSSGSVHELKAEEKLPPEASFDPRKKKRRFGR